MQAQTENIGPVIDRFNDAFQRHDPALLVDLIAPDCVLENTTPAPNGSRHVGGAACLALWQGIASDREGRFDLEEVVLLQDHALIYWHYRHGASATRGINIMRVRDGRIVEGRGYVKA
ncbi:MAG TPA: nuclear transport factor 2 family protein [Burkholderiaceae bacterium]|nr:nuclear transport factor 2 family protein [Burkholderiaceae bacterium]